MLNREKKAPWNPYRRMVQFEEKLASKMVYKSDRRDEVKKMGFHFTKHLATFRQIMMYLKMMKKFFSEAFFRSSMSNGRGKTKLVQRKNQN